MKLTKKITKTLILSGATALAFGAVAAGTTYALFTSNAENEIVVTSGKISVTSTIEVKEKYRPASISQSEGNEIVDPTNIADSSDLEVGVEGSNVKIAKMLPGDKVTLTVTPKNNSNVKIKYRETYSFVGDATSDLKITGDENMVKLWTELGVGEDIEAYEIVVELPTTATTEIEEATIKLGIEAVQGNAAVYNAEVSTAEGLDEVLSADSDSVSVKLDGDIALSTALEITKDVTIYGDGSTTISSTATRAINVNDNTEKAVTLKLVGVNLDCSDIERGISVYGNKEVNIILENCNISADHYAVNIASENQKTNVVIRNSTLVGYSAFQTFSSNTTAIIENCTLIGNNKWSGNSDDYATIVTVKGAKNLNLTFKNCTIEANELGTANEKIADFREENAGNVRFSGCEFRHNDDKITDSKTEYIKVSSGTVVTVDGKKLA